MTTSWMAAVLLGGVLALGGRSLGAGPLGDCPQCAPGKLCAPHREQETATLAAARKELATAEGDARLAAYRAIAALEEAHANVPSPAALRALGGGLEEESGEVVAEVLRLLAGSFHRELVLGELERGLTAVARKSSELEAGLSGHTLPPKPKDPAGAAEHERKLAALRAQLAADQARIAALDANAARIADEIAKFRDDRAVAILATALASRQRGAPKALLAARLVDYGTAPALEAVVKWLPTLATVPSGLTPASAEQLRAARKKAYLQIDAALRDLCGARRLAPPPDPATAEAWAKWLRDHKKELPARLAAPAAPKGDDAADDGTPDKGAPDKDEEEDEEEDEQSEAAHAEEDAGRGRR